MKPSLISLFTKECVHSLLSLRQVRDSKMNIAKPDDVPIPYDDVKNPCRTSYGYPNAGTSHSLGAAALLLSLALLMGILAL